MRYTACKLRLLRSNHLCKSSSSSDSYKQPKFPVFDVSYCWWKKSQATTWHTCIIKPCKCSNKLPINWCRVSSINSVFFSGNFKESVPKTTPKRHQRHRYGHHARYEETGVGTTGKRLILGTFLRFFRFFLRGGSVAFFCIGIFSLGFSLVVIENSR